MNLIWLTDTGLWIPLVTVAEVIHVQCLSSACPPLLRSCFCNNGRSYERQGYNSLALVLADSRSVIEPGGDIRDLEVCL